MASPALPTELPLHSQLKTRQLALLAALAENGSLRRAAAAISITQPAATHLLHDLEQAVGVPLFERRAWGMEPTTYGETLIRCARGVLSDLAAARTELAALAAGAKGMLRCGCVTGGVPRLLAPAIHVIRQGRPGLRVFMLVNTSDVLVAALAQGTLDVAIGRLPAHADAGSFVTEPLGDEPLCIVGRAEHPLARGRRPVPTSALAGATWILQPPDSPMRQDVDAILARANLRLPADLIETASIVATLALLQDSDAIAALPLDLAVHYERQNLLVRLPVDLPPGGSAFELITRANRALSPAAAQFVAAVRKAAGTTGTPRGVRRARQR